MDKVTTILVAALKQALADPVEQRLYRSGKLSGLFAGRGGANGDAAAQALRDRLLEVVRTETKGKTVIDWVRLTPRGVDFLHDHESPVEALHDLRSYLMIANKGQLRRKRGDELVNQASSLNLVTNAVVVWNTVYMQAALHALQAEGYPVREEDLGHLWPTRFTHVHRYGKYQFNVAEAKARKGLRLLKA